jgi:DNA (cytosine-5)-methyltransferase 1
VNELALFAGAGGGILAGKLLGWNTVCAVEYAAYPASVLVARQNDGLLAPFPIWDDVTTFDGKPWKGIVDVISGGFPCQDISPAGKGAGLSGERSGLWFEMLRVINEAKPLFVFIENSSNLRTKGLNTVLEGLSESGYNVAWGVLSAADIGSNHKRPRMWILGVLADTYDSGSVEDTCKSKLWSERSQQPPENPGRTHAGERYQKWQSIWWHIDPATVFIGEAEAAKPYVGRVADGVAARVDRLKAIGNGQVPSCHAVAWCQLYESLLGVEYDLSRLRD